MTDSKRPKARHVRFLSKGFFPPEMPSCFYSETLGAGRDHITNKLSAIPPKNGRPDYHFFKGERASFNFPRFGREDRRHSYINPISYFFLSQILAEKYVGIRKLNRRSKMSVAPTIFDWAGERALIRPAFDARESERVTLNASYELLAEADIASFFHSVYTHAIAWAIHGKAVAKQRKQDIGLLGNQVDLLVRNAQGGQTIGLPVGPDTSRLIAEVIATAIDKSIQTVLKRKRNWSSKERGAMRFVDDFTFGCSSQQEADVVIAAVRRCANEYELDLNNSKTRTISTGPFFPAAWTEHVRGLLPTNGADRSRLFQYFYGIEAAARAHPESNVQKFALQNARKLFLETDEWRLVEDFLLSSYRQNPTVLPVLFEILVVRHFDRKDVSTERIGKFVASRLPALIRVQKNGEILWLLFLCICLGAPIPASAVSELFSIDDGAVAVLITDASKLGVIKGPIDRSKWDLNLTADGLRGAMWLYAYEAARIAGSSDAHVTGDPYFGVLWGADVRFYRSGPFHFNKNLLLSRLRVERLRQLAQQVAVQENLAEDIDDFEATTDAEQKDTYEEEFY